ncbi:hypothetical protein [Kutzneria chonburiensis]|uniref:DUF2397 family protein n=1 Tax=Kutzneria chonburiensis TaxID=1483604 RepID=A0ABV6MNM0_9PSEU|nr:hypothetical protein [Kutzneria chonburiensis]
MTELDLFSPEPEPEPDAAFLDRLKAFMAPVAHQSDAVIKDPELLRWAHAVYEAFGDRDDTGEGLTVAEIEAACGQAGPGTFESRLAVFKALGLVAAPRDQAYHRRLVFSTTGVAALLLFERLRREGGVQEILLLLDQTTQGIRDGLLGPDDVAAKLATLRRALAINAGELAQLRTRPVMELVAQRRNHRAADRLLFQAKTLVEVVETRFPQLSAAGGQLITQALRYSAAANELVDRLLRQVRAERDFSMLEPEQYRTAALYSDTEALAAVFGRTVFDKPAAAIGPEQILLTLEQHRPREVSQRPPRPVDLPTTDDPVARSHHRREALRRRRAAAVQIHLKGQPEVDLTAEIQAAGWPGAAKLVIDLLAASADPEIPVTVTLSTALLVDGTASVTYLTPLRLCRATKDDDDG